MPLKIQMPPLVKSVAVIGLITLLGAVTATALDGTMQLTKFVSALAFPCGLIWLLLWTTCLWCFFQGQRRIGSAVLAVTLLYSFFGCEITAGLISNQLEHRFEYVDPATCEVFDRVVVLGGGVDVLDPEHQELGRSGDRVMMAARLYHLGKAKKIIITGTGPTWRDESEYSPSRATFKIMTEIGVDSAAIEMIEGRTTSEEMKNLKSFFGKSEIDSPVGLITSATHLPRALRLANVNGLTFKPIPADFEGNSFGHTLINVMPTFAGFRKSERGIKEYLAKIVGR